MTDKKAWTPEQMAMIDLFGDHNYAERLKARFLFEDDESTYIAEDGREVTVPFLVAEYRGGKEFVFDDYEDDLDGVE